QIYDGKLYPDIQVNTFRNIDRLFPTRTVARGGAVSTLPLSEQPLQDFSYRVDGKTYDLYDVLSMNRVSGLLIIHDGEILFESTCWAITRIRAGCRCRWLSRLRQP
ncbi:hypothetical protein ORJ04_20960, partial [Rheinheimera baltica]|nr:hypothetical protein [Rheinheimera baltica]